MWSYEHGNFTVHQIPALQDNYIYLIATDTLLACVDPAEPSSVIAACEHLGRRLTHILNTHHHWDHTGGNLALKKQFACKIVGAASDLRRIPGIDLTVAEKDEPELNGLTVSVLEVPGHTRGHIAYLIAGDSHDALFCGDTLFGAGCGRLFEGTPGQMWHSLQKLMALDDDTGIYCAHEYTLNNLAFCLKKVADTDAIKAYHGWSKQRSSEGLPTVPGRMGREKACNPMLLPALQAFRENYAASHGIADDPVSVFTHIRGARDHW